MTAGWVVIRNIGDGTWHVVSAFTYPTRADALAGLDFVRHGTRRPLRDAYAIARVEPVPECEGTP